MQKLKIVCIQARSNFKQKLIIYCAPKYSIWLTNCANADKYKLTKSPNKAKKPSNLDTSSI